MNKVILLLLAVILCICFAGCAKTPTAQDAQSSQGDMTGLITIDDYISNYNSNYENLDSYIQGFLPGSLSKASFLKEDTATFTTYKLKEGANLTLNCSGIDGSVYYLEYVYYYPDYTGEYDDIRGTANLLVIELLYPLLKSDFEDSWGIMDIYGDLQENFKGKEVTQKTDDKIYSYSTYESGNDIALIYSVWIVSE
jgi:hypothetical protein